MYSLAGLDVAYIPLPLLTISVVSCATTIYPHPSTYLGSHQVVKWLIISFNYPNLGRSLPFYFKQHAKQYKMQLIDKKI
jgi:hypothetical protein